MASWTGLLQDYYRIITGLLAFEKQKWEAKLHKEEAEREERMAEREEKKAEREDRLRKEEVEREERKADVTFLSEVKSEYRNL